MVNEFDVKVGDMNVFVRNPRTIEVTFECLYSTEVKVKTEYIDINAVDVKDSAQGFGTFDEGFEIELFTDEFVTPVSAENVYIGSNLFVKTAWKVTTLLDKLSFYVDQVIKIYHMSA